MLHIKECVNLFGPLSSFSAFAFQENVSEINHLSRKPQDILQKLFNRFDEIKNIKNQSRNIYPGTRTRTYTFDIFKLRSNSRANSCCYLEKENASIMITEIDIPNNIVRGKRYISRENFFSFPDDSSCWGIHLVDNLSDKIETFPLNHVTLKYYRLPYENKFVLIPLLNFDDIIPLV